ncbi:MAG: hypothetical protein Q9174_005883 [Haloplaca sp. 1 TL-2023]
MVTLAHKPLGRSGEGSDISIIGIDIPSNSSYVFRDQIVRENALEILDIAPAVTAYGQGVFCLYSIQGEKHLMLVTSNQDTSTGNIYDREALLKCPEDAIALGTFSDDSGFSSLLVGTTNGLVYFDSSQAVESDEEGSLISQDPLFQYNKQILVAQDSDALAIWAINNSDELGYLRTTIENLDKGSPVLLLSSGQASAFSPLLQKTSGSTSATLSHTLIVNDSHGNLTFLTQTSDTGLWQKQPFYVTDSSEMYEIASYTTRVVLRDSEGGVLKHAKAFMSVTSSTQATSNGKRVTLQQSGSWITADEDGEITLITPTQDIGSAVMTISRIRDTEGHELICGPTTIDPSAKVMECLSHINHDFDLATAHTKSGKPLFEGSCVPDKATLKAASQCFDALNAAHRDLPGTGASIATAAGSLATKAVVPITRTALEAVGDLLWDAWYWIEQKVRDVRNWFVEKVGEVKQFVLDCAEKVGRAATWVFEKLKVGWNTLCDFVGFLFNWDDIVQTKNTISQLLSANLDLAAEKVDQKRTEVQGLFKAVRQKVGDAVYPKGIKADPDKSSKDPKVKEATSGSAFHLTSYHMKNSDMANSTELASGGSNVDATTSETDSLWKTLTGIWQRIQAELVKLCDALSDKFFGTGKKIDVDVMFTILGDVLTGAIDGVAEIVDTLMSFAIKFIKLIKEYGNKEIKIPIFSPLYKKVSGGHELTVFDAVSLLVAIPTTVLIKCVTGKAPPKFSEKIDSSFLRRIHNTKDSTISKQTRIDYNTLKTGAGISFVLLATAWKGIKFLCSLARKGTAGALKLLEKTKSPFPAFTILSMGLECIGLMCSIPTISEDLPGSTLRHWIVTLSTVRVGTNAIFMILGWDGNDVGEKFLLGVDAVIALAKFGLYQAVCVEELNAVGWKEKNPEMTAVGSVACVFSTSASVGYFMVFFYKTSAPQASGVGLGLEKIGSFALVAVETRLFVEQYRRGCETRLVIPN